MKEKKNKKKKKIYKSTIVFIILDIIVAACFFITYGPYDKLRNLYVTTAMKTMNHQYFAKIFYSDATIEKIMASNYFVEIFSISFTISFTLTRPSCTLFQEREGIISHCESLAEAIQLFET